MPSRGLIGSLTAADAGRHPGDAGEEPAEERLAGRDLLRRQVTGLALPRRNAAEALADAALPLGCAGEPRAERDAVLLGRRLDGCRHLVDERDRPLRNHRSRVTPQVLLPVRWGA